MLHLLALAVALTGPVPVAIERSVQERLGEVRVQVLELSGATVRRCEGATVRSGGPEVRSEGPEVGCKSPKAIPEPGSRLGRPIRFILFANGVRTGSVVATLNVTGAAVRSTRAVARGEELDAGAVEVADAELKGILLARLPKMSEIAGARARRDIGVGELLTAAAVIVPPIVKSGDEVRVTVSAGAVQVSGMGRASGSGHAGELIHVLLPSSRRGVSARITGPGSVEIVR